MDIISKYKYKNEGGSPSHSFLLPKTIQILESLNYPCKRIFEVGCGNGFIANELSKKGWNVSGVDPSREGICLAKNYYPDLDLNIGSAYDRLSDIYGKFPIVLSIEVIEHLYDPRSYLKELYNLLDDRGTLIISTPFHGYWKNLLLSLTGKMDQHFTALWDNGHIKFWSKKTLSLILQESGFNHIKFYLVGRIPPFSKSMIVVIQK